MSTTVTMRPRRLSTPAISADDKGTRVSRSGMNTSCTREIGKPNSWPPITAVTYSATAPSMVSVLFIVFGLSYLRRPLDVGGLFLQRRDQAGPVELGDIVMEAGLPAALDRRRGDHRRQRDDRHLAKIVVGADHFGELKAVHVGHLDVGQHDVKGLGAQRRQALLGIGGGPDLVAGGLEHRGQHVAEEG